MNEALLAVRGLRVDFVTEGGPLRAVDGVSFDLSPGEVLAIVGESGSGKSVTAQTILGLTRSPNARIEGTASLRGEELLAASEAELRKVRGDRIAMVFQDPLTSLNPVRRVGDQIVEAIRAHRERIGRREARRLTVEMLDSVGIPKAEQRIDSRTRTSSPGECGSGAMIAMALSCNPEAPHRRRADHRPRRVDPGTDSRSDGVAPGTSTECRSCSSPTTWG